MRCCKTERLQQLGLLLHSTCFFYKSRDRNSNGVTRVGVTRGGNWCCRPIFLKKKLATFFIYCPLENDRLFVVSSPLPSSHVVYPVFFLNSARKKIISFGCHPLDGVTRGGPPPSCPPVTPLRNSIKHFAVTDVTSKKKTSKKNVGMLVVYVYKPQSTQKLAISD